MGVFSVSNMTQKTQKCKNVYKLRGKFVFIIQNNPKNLDYIFGIVVERKKITSYNCIIGNDGFDMRVGSRCGIEKSHLKTAL